jgi:large subunit ribosomal protein LP0
MVKMDRKEWKKNYFERLETCFTKWSKCVVVGIANVRSRQMQDVRIALRGKAELVMGKNTLIRRVMRDMVERVPHVEALLDHVVGNVGFIFTDMDCVALRDVLEEHRCVAPAKAGVVAPVDVVLEPGPTGMGPEKTSFFQALNLGTKIVRGSIELITSEHIITAGDIVGISESKLCNMLGISPFFYGIELVMIMEGESIYPPAVLDIKPETLLASFRSAANNVAAICLEIGYPTTASIGHSIMNGFMNCLAISVETDYTFAEAEKVKAYLENPDAFVAAAPAGGDAAPAAAAAAPPPPEESEEEEMEMGLFD